MNYHSNDRPDQGIGRSADTGHSPIGLFIAICGVLVVGVAVRLLGIDWLIGSGIQPDFSFHPDDHRFVEAAKSFRDYPTLFGYVLGMVTQLFVALSAANAAGLDVNALLTLRSITLVHAAITIVLTCTLSLAWSVDRKQAVLAGLLLALCPLHVVNSNFGTADISAVSLFYLTIMAGAQYLRTGDRVWFTTMTALCGFAIAVKFFIPLLVAVAIVVLTEDRGRRWDSCLSASFILAGAVSIASFFNYTPWDFAALLHMILYDNVSLINGKTPFENAYLYLWRLLPALSTPVAVLAVAGIVMRIAAWPALLRNLRGSVSHARLRSAFRTPVGLLASALVVYGAMIITAAVSSTRHLLVYMPVLCVLASSVFIRLLKGVSVGRLSQLLITGLFFAYVCYNAVGLQRLYRTDIRADAAVWTRTVVEKGHRVHASSFYTPVRGTSFDRHRDLDSIPDGDYLLTCNLEYERYLSQSDSRQIFHAKGGQARVDFFREVFFGQSRFTVVEVFRQDLYTLEQRLIAAGWLPPLDTFTPSLCLALGTSSGLSDDVQKAVLREAVEIRRGI